MKLDRWELIVLKRGLLQLRDLPSSHETGMSEEFEVLYKKVSDEIEKEDKRLKANA